jgi:hypothetical protein
LRIIELESSSPAVVVKTKASNQIQPNPRFGERTFKKKTVAAGPEKAAHAPQPTRKLALDYEYKSTWHVELVEAAAHLQWRFVREHGNIRNATAARPALRD